MNVIVDQQIEIVTSQSLLRLQVNHSWSPDEFATLINASYSLYNLKLFFETLIRAEGRDGFVYYMINRRLLNGNQATLEQVNELMIHNFIRKGVQPLSTEIITSIVSRYDLQYKLDLHGVKYNSPGSIDLLGLSGIVHAVKDFILEIRNQSFEKKKYQDGAMLRAMAEREQLFQLKGMINEATRLRELQVRNRVLQDWEDRKRRLDEIERFLSISKEYGIPVSVINNLVEGTEEDIRKLEFYFSLDKLENVKIVDINN